MNEPAAAPAAAPASPAPAPAAPAPAGEVVINPNPTSTPQPVGSQAPERPTGETIEGNKHRPETRRESIRKAFERATAPDAAPKKPAPARPKQAAPAADKTDQRLEGGQEKPGQRPAQHREQGRFARAPAQAGAEPGQATGATPGEPGQRTPPKALPENAPFRDPPRRMSERAKAEWAAAPESVRGEIHRMSKEFDGAYRQLGGDHEEMNKIRRFHQMATEHGTTLDRALNNYTEMEKKLRSDPIGGLDLIVNNLNLRTSDGRKLGLRDVAYHVLSQSPEQLQSVQMKNAAGAQSHQIGQLHETVQTLAQTVQQMQHQQQFGQTRSAVDQFADSHPGFDEVGDLIEQELRFGFPLEEAYQRAIRLRPPTRAAQTGNPAPQTRKEDKSISGAPGAGADNAPTAKRRDGKSVGRREAISNAIRRVNGSV